MCLISMYDKLKATGSVIIQHKNLVLQLNNNLSLSF